jgi:hypothetical protein
MNKFCPTNVRHMLECVDYRLQTYVCIECEHLYELHDGRLIRVEYRPIYGKDPFRLARENREQRRKDFDKRTAFRNDVGIRRLYAECRTGR